MTCQITWGCCPEHGATLSTSGGVTTCRHHSGCARVWSYDRLTPACVETATHRVTDLDDETAVVCDGHAVTARDRIEGATLTRL